MWIARTLLHSMPYSLPAVLLLILNSRLPARPVDLADDYGTTVRPLVQKYCLTCHSTKAAKGDLDLQQFGSLADVRKDVRVWQAVAEKLENGTMPPRKAAQPSAEERSRLLRWTSHFLNDEAARLSGDPGRVPVRRLSNAEYNNTVRDLTRVDLQPARDFPADGAAGEGFTNVGDALAISPALLNKYLDAAKDIAAHAVLLPDGFRFSLSRTPQDWIAEALQNLRDFHEQYSSEGSLPLADYIPVTIRYRDDLLAGRTDIETVAKKEELSAKYLRVLWQALTDSRPSYPLDVIRTEWRHTQEKDAPGLMVLISSRQISLWKFVQIGCYRDGNTVRQLPNDVPDPTAPPTADLTRGYAEFRAVFPLQIFYGKIIPDDEPFSLKLYHREDEALRRLFLGEASGKQLDRLWEELHFISQTPAVEYHHFPFFLSFIAAIGQDSSYHEGQRATFRRRAEAFEMEVEAAAQKQLAALVNFAARAYRRPLTKQEKADLIKLYDDLRIKGSAHDEAFRTTLTRILVSPNFLFRNEEALPGNEAHPVSAWELATRLSYFVWASMPDTELCRLATDGNLQDPKVLSAQVTRMLKDARVRGLATEFAAQWLQVRDLQQNREKNEKLFPTFDHALRDALFEETALFWQDVFQSDRPIHDLIDADDTFLNDVLARHYGIPGVEGPEWRRVNSIRQYHRGGILTLGSILTRQSGASRTSPILRGNWVVQVLLGEKLPRPPPDVPKLPENELNTEGTVRQLVEKHVRVAECAVCHQRIDPFGFALEHYDPIGRYRDADLAGRPIDTQVKLMNGTAFEGIDGLRSYLVEQRGDDIRKHFCEKLLGYALGRSLQLSDQPLIEQMQRELKQNRDHMSAAIQTIANSRPFRYHRGLDATKDE